MEIQKRLQSLLLFAVILLPFPSFSNSRNTISPIQSLRDGETLISADQSFALGFFSPGKSKNRYVGIWFHKIPEKTIVWVANRVNPVTDSSGILTIKGGNLALVQGGLNNNSLILWSTKISTVTNDSTATLMDSSNLVMRDDQHRVLWESFDYPAHAFLPNMKIGLDRRTGLNRVVTSWKSVDDPAPGELSIGFDPRGMPQIFITKKLDRIWRSGPWTGKGFSSIPGMDHDPTYNYMHVANNDEVYFAYSNKNGMIISMFAMDISGVLQQLMWNNKNRRWNLIAGYPGASCDQYAYCGPYSSCDINQAFECTCLRGFEPTTPRGWNIRDWSDGCRRLRLLDCKGKNDGFLKLARVSLPDTSRARVELDLSLEACKEECLKNCSCTAYATANINTAGEGSGCVIWYGELIDIRIVGDEGQILYTRLASSEIVVSTNAANNKMTIRRGILGLKKILTIPLPAALVVVTLVTFGYFS